MLSVGKPEMLMLSRVHDQFRQISKISKKLNSILIVY